MIYFSNDIDRNQGERRGCKKTVISQVPATAALHAKSGGDGASNILSENSSAG